MVKGFGSSIASLPGLAAIGGGAYGVKSLIDTADAYVNLEAKLSSLLGSQALAADAQNQLFEMSQLTKSSVVENADALTRLVIASDMTGLSYQENIAVLGAMNEAFALSGASADEAKRAIVQLSQGLASGVLQGDELRSLRENAPLLMKELADALGVGVGALKQMGADGELTSEVLGDAFRRIAQDAQSTLGQEVPDTAARGFQVVVNSFQKVWDNISDNIGLIDFVVESFEMLSDWIIANEDKITGWAIVLRENISKIAPEITKFVSSAVPQLSSFITMVTTLIERLQQAWEIAVNVMRFSPAGILASAGGAVAGYASGGGFGGTDIPGGSGTGEFGGAGGTNIIVNTPMNNNDIINLKTDLDRKNSRN